MASKKTYRYYGSLVVGFIISAATFLTIILTAPSASLLGIFLQSLLIALGATGYGVLVFGCAVLAGLLGIGLGLLVHCIMGYFQNKLKKPDRNLVILETEMEQKKAELQPSFTETNLLLNQTDDRNEIKEFKSWGKEIAIILYQKTLAEDKEIEEFLKNSSGVLAKKYKKLAFTYHPDKEPDIAKKEEKTKAFQEINNTYKTIQNCWELALYSINPESEMTIDDLEMERLRLLKEQNALLKKYIELLQKAYEQIDEKIAKELEVIFSKENRAKIKAEIKAGIIADLEKEDIYPAYNPSFWENPCKNIRQTVSNIRKSVSDTWDAYKNS